MIPSCVMQAAKDPAIRGVTLSVYVTLFEFLSFWEFRPAKLTSVSSRTGLKKPNVSRAVSILVDRGYLERGQDDGALRTYRLTVSPTPLAGRGVITSATIQLA